MLWDDLEGWDGGEGGTEAPEGGGIADSLCCAAETNATCNTAIPQLKNFFKKKRRPSLLSWGSLAATGLAMYSLTLSYPLQI